MSMNPEIAVYRAEVELIDGRLFAIEFCCKHWPASYWEPCDWDIVDVKYLIDEKPVDECDLPPEVTIELTDRMWDIAEPISYEKLN